MTPGGGSTSAPVGVFAEAAGSRFGAGLGMPDEAASLGDPIGSVDRAAMPDEALDLVGDAIKQ